jgi:ABC-2 type transport system permease protein
MVNLNLIQYLSGENPPIAGMDLTFSLAVLSVWSLIALAISFRVFTKQDIY